MTRSCCPLVLMLVAVITLCGCRSAYYGTWEQLGYHKRDILVERVEKARADQEDAKEQFRDALEAFQSLVDFEGGDLRATYDRLSAQLDRSEDRAAAVSDRIDSVDRVATDLFDEWERELNQYESADLRARSEEQLRATRERYAQLYTAMRRAESKMEPVLLAFRDQVLFLKHNLNAQAIASLQGEVVSLQAEIDDLIAEMEAAIAEADAFIASMSSGQ